MPSSVTSQVQIVKDAHEDYLRLVTWRVPLKLNFLLVLGFFTLVIIFMSLWVSLKVAGWITEPVRALAQATEDIAAGDLSVIVHSKSRDEMGLLVNSFNRMVRELRENKDSIQRAYAESDRRRLSMQNIVENIGSGVISFDAEGNVAAINSAALRILDLNADQVLDRNYSVLLSEIGSYELQNSIKDINIRTLDAEEREVVTTISGRRVNLKLTLTGLRDETTGYHGMLAVFEDITNLIKAQRALAWQEVARRMAHEIKNPLTPIKLSTERMVKKWQAGSESFGTIFERSTSTIIREVDSLRRLVDEFAKFGKMPEINKKPTQIKTVVQDAASLYSAYKGLDITVQGQDVVAEIDPEQFKRVIINLFDNAAEAMGKIGKITVEIREELQNQTAFVEVADEGPGIEDKDRLFMPYFSTRKNGTGLGLAIADRIITEHGGAIKVADNKPRGSVFILELPLKEVQ